MNRSARCLSYLLCALVILAVSFLLPNETEAAARRVRRAPIRTGSAGGSAAPKTFARGAGTQKSPYVITTAAQLTAFAASVSGGTDYAGKYIRLGADIDLKDTVWTPAGYYANGSSRFFKGVFSGAGFTIYNMGASNGAKPAASLFGALSGATLDSVSLQFVEVAGDSNVGGLAGFVTGSSLKNCLVSGTVKGRSAVGGIAGSTLNGFIENCRFSGSVTGESGVGGLVGAVDRTAVRSCAVTGSVEAGTDAGGFVGGVLDGMIVDCTAESVTVSGGNNVGGFAGNIIDGGFVSKAVFQGQVLGNSNAGGVAGLMTAGRVVSCSVSGSVKGRERAGGIVGEMTAGEVRDCESTADVNGMAGLGGIAGLMSGGNLDKNVNRGVISGGEAVGGIVGNFAGGTTSFSSNTSTGHVNGYSNTGLLVGLQAQIIN